MACFTVFNAHLCLLLAFLFCLKYRQFSFAIVVLLNYIAPFSCLFFIFCLSFYPKQTAFGRALQQWSFSRSVACQATLQILNVPTFTHTHKHTHPIGSISGDHWLKQWAFWAEEIDYMYGKMINKGGQPCRSPFVFKSCWILWTVWMNI